MKSVAIVLLIALAALAPARAALQCRTVNFDGAGLAANQILTGNEWAGAGPSDPAGFTLTGSYPGFDVPFQPRVYDTEWDGMTPIEVEDDDLTTPSVYNLPCCSFPLPGEENDKHYSLATNTVPRGLVLVGQSVGHLNEPLANDNGGGATFNFQFNFPVHINHLTVLDVEAGEGFGDIVAHPNGGGEPLVRFFHDVTDNEGNPILGNNVITEVDTHLDNVIALDVHFVSSGAIAELRYCYDDACTVEDCCVGPDCDLIECSEEPCPCAVGAPSVIWPDDCPDTTVASTTGRCLCVQFGGGDGDDGDCDARPMPVQAPPPPQDD